MAKAPPPPPPKPPVAPITAHGASLPGREPERDDVGAVPFVVILAAAVAINFAALAVLSAVAVLASRAIKVLIREAG